MPTPKDREELRRAVAGFNGRFFYDGERGDIGYIAKECDEKRCDCPPHKNSDGDQDCSISIGGVGGVDESVGEPAVRMLNAIGPLLDQLDEVTRALGEAKTALANLRRGDWEIGYVHERIDRIIKQAEEAL